MKISRSILFASAADGFRTVDNVASTLGAKQKVRKVENNFVLARANPECEENQEFICPDGKKCGEWECPNLENNTYCNLKCDSGYEVYGSAVRKCDCFKEIGPIEIFTGCKWEKNSSFGCRPVGTTTPTATTTSTTTSTTETPEYDEEEVEYEEESEGDEDFTGRRKHIEITQSQPAPTGQPRMANDFLGWSGNHMNKMQNENEEEEEEENEDSRSISFQEQEQQLNREKGTRWGPIRFLQPSKAPSVTAFTFNFDTIKAELGGPKPTRHPNLDPILDTTRKPKKTTKAKTTTSTTTTTTTTATTTSTTTSTTTTSTTTTTTKKTKPETTQPTVTEDVEWTIPVEFRQCPDDELPAKDEWSCNKQDFIHGTTCLFECPGFKKAFRKKCICRKDRECKWNTRSIPKCLKNLNADELAQYGARSHSESLMLNDVFPQITPNEEVQREVEEIELEMIERITEEEKWASEAIANIAGRNGISFKPISPSESNDIRTLEHEGSTYIHPFDFFQSLQRWMYELGFFNFSGKNES